MIYNPIFNIIIEIIYSLKNRINSMKEIKQKAKSIYIITFIKLNQYENEQNNLLLETKRVNFKTQ